MASRMRGRRFPPRGDGRKPKCWAATALMHAGWQRDDTPPDRSVHSPPQSRFTALFSFRPHLPEVLCFFPRVLNELNGPAARRRGWGGGVVEGRGMWGSWSRGRGVCSRRAAGISGLFRNLGFFCGTGAGKIKYDGGVRRSPMSR